MKEFLSGRGFVHRDIAARNILVDERNGCKIGDFGLCRRVQQEQELYLSRVSLKQFSMTMINLFRM